MPTPLGFAKRNGSKTSHSSMAGLFHRHRDKGYLSNKMFCLNARKRTAWYALLRIPLCKFFVL